MCLRAARSACGEDRGKGIDTRLKYEGTANVSMAGGWEAMTTVSAGGDTGTAVYPFSASQ
jgi:hypothetical protein